ncbi:MAG: GNAT family N-acetyltransferase [Chitinophagaceae bacterium]|nr:MAG: GNAT family N-acetyltransferase [Chitinophagaceae bacterium]
MISRAITADARILAEIGAKTFIDAHKDSAPPDEIDAYVQEKYNLAAIKKELADTKNIYHLIGQGNTIAGFSKLLMDTPLPGLPPGNVAKMDQLYLSRDFHGLKLGAELLSYNIRYAEDACQSGMWLVVWQGNGQAIRFYQKFGFAIIKEDFFQLTPTHISPCQFMFLDFKKVLI